METSFASRDDGDSAFSRIDLLVVILTVAILAMALLPALARVHVNAQGGQCLSNLRQLTAGWWMYVNDYQGRLAPNRGPFPANQDYDVYPKWVAGDMRGSSTLQPGTIDATNSALLVDPRYSQLAGYVKAPALYRCPADLSTWGRIPVARVRSYSMNEAVGCALNGTTQDIGHAPIGHWLSSGNASTPGYPWRVYIKESDLVAPTPSQLWLMLDEHPNGIDDAEFAVQMPINPGSTFWIDYPAPYHNNAGDFSFADGHVENHKWQAPSAIPAVIWTADSSGMIGGSPTSVPNNPDILWLAHRTSALEPGVVGVFQP